MGARAPRRDPAGPRRPAGAPVRIASARPRTRWARRWPPRSPQIEDEIANLRSLITELRPAALDELGLGAAIEGLVDNHAAATGMDIQVNLALAREGGIVTERLDRELESSVYRLVQEALTNVAKHARGGDRLDRGRAGPDLGLDRRPRRRHRLRHGRAPDRLRPDRHARARRPGRRQPDDRLHPGSRHGPKRPNPPRTPSPRPPPRRRSAALTATKGSDPGSDPCDEPYKGARRRVAGVVVVDAEEIATQ